MEKAAENQNQQAQSRAVAENTTQQKESSDSALEFVDNRPEAATQLRMAEMMNNSPYHSEQNKLASMVRGTAQREEIGEVKETIQIKTEPTQLKENKTGMPDGLKNGLENLSGMSMDHVNIHYNSPEPAQLNAHAFTQGSDIHVASGQERHLAHEGWHVVQQAQSRVQPTMQMAGTQINDDVGLEKEADVMGGKALSVGQRVAQKVEGGEGNKMGSVPIFPIKSTTINTSVSQQKPVVQRWSIAMIDDERDRLRAADKTFGGKIAIHHIISRDHIDKMIIFVNQVACSGGEMARRMPEAKKAASGFLKSITTAVSESFGREKTTFQEQTRGSANKVLHNLPVNLVGGPAAPLADAGTSFDPVTVPKAGAAAGEDDRVLDQRSQYLLAMLDQFNLLKIARATEDDDGAADAFNAMGVALLAAVKSLATPASIDLTPDDWFAHGGGHTKKQVGKYRDDPTGRPLFVAARAAPAPIPAAAFNIPAVAFGGMMLDLNIAAARITHVFQRHSYQHFDFNTQIKLRNTFWADGLTVAKINADIQAKAAQFHLYLLAELVDKKIEDLDNMNINLQLPGMFCIALITGDWGGPSDAEGNPLHYTAEVETIAPDGQDQYTAAELTLIHVHVP